MYMPMTAVGRRKLLRKTIQDRIATDPFIRGGKAWAAIPQPVLAETLGVSLKTLYNWTNQPPYQREVAKNAQGVKVSLLRIVDDQDDAASVAPTPQHVANKMRKMIREDFPDLHAHMSKAHHGCLIGLALEWPEGYQLEILRHCLKHWDDFATAAKHMLEEAALDGGEPFTPRFYKFPNLNFMRKAQAAGPAVYAMSLMAKQQFVPEPIMSLLMKLDCFGI